MANFVNVSASAIEGWLEARRFERTVQFHEVVYVRKSRDYPDVCIKVYTSVRVGRQQARDRGRDSIKVAVVYDNGRKSFGIGKFPHVNRVTSEQAVIARLEERVRAAAERGKEWIRQQGGPRYRRLDAPKPVADEPPPANYMGEGDPETCRTCHVRKCPDGCCCAC